MEILPAAGAHRSCIFLPLAIVSLLFSSLPAAQLISNEQGPGASAVGVQEESLLWIRPMALSNGWPIHSFALNDSGMLVFGGGNPYGDADGLVLVAGDMFTRIAFFGESIAGIEDGVFWGASRFSLNDRGDVAFTGSLRNSSGFVNSLFLFSGGQLKQVLRNGDPVPASPGKAFFVFDRVWLNNRGMILFVGLVGNISLGFQALEPGLFIYSEDRVEKIALRDDSTPFGDAFGFGSFTPVFFNDDGIVTTWGGGRIFRFANGEVLPVIGRGDALVEGKTIYDFNLDSLFVNDAGDVVFQASFGPQPSDQGLFLRAKDGGVVQLLVDGAPTPVGGTFSLWYTETGRDRFGRPFQRNVTVPLSPILNNAGSVLFSAHVKAGESLGGIFLFSEGALKKVAADGDPVSDDAASRYALVAFLNEQPLLPTKYSLNDSDTAVFTADIRGQSSTSSGIFLYAEGNVRKVASSGDLASETRAQVFSLGLNGPFTSVPFTTPLLNNRGDIGFWSELGNGEFERGIFLAAIAQPLVLPNGDFETTAANGLPTNWTTAWSNSGTGEALIYDSGGSASFDGKNVLRLHVGPGGGSIFVLSDPIPMSSDSTHLITSQMRFNLEGPFDAVYFSVMQLDRAGNESGFGEAKGFSGDNFWDWKQEQLGFRTVPDTATIRVRFGLVSARESFLDVDAVQ